jgi:hypothetical protein
MNWEFVTDSRIYFYVISGSVSGVALCSVLVGCDAVPDTSKVRVTAIFRVKQSC